MANGFRPFGDAPDILARLAVQQASPQQDLVRARLRQVQDEQMRSNLVTQFLMTADLKRFKPSDVQSAIGAITGDPNLAVKAAESRLREGLFAEQRQQFRGLGRELGTATAAGSSGGVQVTEAESADITSRLLQQGATPEVIDELRNVIGQQQATRRTDVNIRGQQISLLREIGDDFGQLQAMRSRNMTIIASDPGKTGITRQDKEKAREENRQINRRLKTLQKAREDAFLGLGVDIRTSKVLAKPTTTRQLLREKKRTVLNLVKRGVLAGVKIRQPKKGAKRDPKFEAFSGPVKESRAFLLMEGYLSEMVRTGKLTPEAAATFEKEFLKDLRSAVGTARPVVGRAAVTREQAARRRELEAQE